MKIYKIGRYSYKEVSEKKFNDIGNDIENTPYQYTTLFMLVDTDGEVIKYLEKVKNPKIFKSKKLKKEVKNGKKNHKTNPSR